MSDQTILSPEVQLYYESRLRELGISDAANVISSPVYQHQGEAWLPTEDLKTKLAFEPCAKGIQINYYLPTGYPIDWRKEGTKHVRNFVRIRLHKEETYQKEGQTHSKKYHQEQGSPVVPYLTPGIISAYTAGREIETLFLIEGEFKAFKAWMASQSVPELASVGWIGLPGIHGFYGGDTNHKREINELIQDVILTCKVRNIVLLLDADTLTLKWKEDKDLSYRPASFANAVKNFRASLHLLLEDKSVALSQVYFMHLKTKYHESTKGLDDLLIQLSAKSKDILLDALNFHFAKQYFEGLIISDGQGSTIEKYFGLQNKESFYALYKDFIGSRPFIWKKNKYEWSGEELKYVKSEEAEAYMRVGIDWLKKVKTPNHRNLLEERVQRWSVAEIKRDYPKYIADQMIERDIPRYDAFFIEPCFDPAKYKRVLHGCYNLMEPLMWDPKPGRFDHTLKFLKHIFGGEARIWWDEESQSYQEEHSAADQFTIAMDYLTILHQHPKQKTFVPCLVSKEQGTGKTTFLEWLCTVYNGNGTILDNERFKMNFNGHYASKFIIGLDEGFLDVEKKAERERLKKMVTSKTMFLEMKGVDVKEIPYYGHLIICSNDADSLMKMEEEDTRWFVVKVNPIPKEDKDPDYEKKLMEEIPHYLHWIQNRKIYHPKVDRLWFSPKDFETEQMRKIIEVTKSRLDAVLENWIKDVFLTYKVPELKIARKSMLRYLNSPEVSKYKIDEKELKYFLEEKRKMKYHDPQRYKIPTHLSVNGDTVTVNYLEEVQRYYHFKPEDWLNDEEYVRYKTNWNVNGEEVKKELEEAGKAQSYTEIEDLFNQDSKDVGF
jgi:hypothetical protein